MDLRLGGCTYPWLWKSDLKASIDYLKRIGIRTLELMLMPPHFPDEWLWKENRTEIYELNEYIKKNDLNVVAVCPMFFGINLASFNPRIREESLRYFHAAIEIAGCFEAPYLTIGLGVRHPLAPEPMKFVWQRAKEAVLESIDLCEQHDVTLGIEVLPGNFMNTADQVLSMVNEIGHELVKIAYDPANTVMIGEDIKTGIMKVKDHLIHFHVSDCKPPQWRHAPIGEGAIDFAEIARTLREIGYQGVTILEIADSDDPFADYERSVVALETMGWRRN